LRKVFVSLVLVPLLASAATPPEGVPLQVRRGFFTETDIGGFFTVGGQDGYSNLQSYLQLGIGYQLSIGEKNAIPIGFHVGIGANAANCWATRTPAGCKESVAAKAEAAADNFTVTFLTLTAGFMRSVLERLYVGGKVLVGYTLLDPAPVAGIRAGVNFGVAGSVEYATNMDHFTIGLDVVYRMILGPNIHTLQFFPRVKYTF
jgi:hypothetical protein